MTGLRQFRLAGTYFPAIVASAIAWLSVAVPADGSPSPTSESVLDLAAPQGKFDAICGSCHGAGGRGGDHAPPLVNSTRLRSRDDADLAYIVHNGTSGGMPAFSLDEVELAQFVALLRSWNPPEESQGPVSQLVAGAEIFFGTGGCGSCHMVHGQGGTNGPDLSSVALRLRREEMDVMLTDPTSQLGIRKTASCPGWAFCPDLQWTVADVTLRNGEFLRGFLRNEGEHDLQLQTFDGQLHLLLERDYASYRREEQSFMPALVSTAEQRRDLLAYLASLRRPTLGPLTTPVPPISAKEISAIARPDASEWPSYDGGPSGNRYSPLSQINRRTVGRLQAHWSFTPGGLGLEGTPIVKDGVMYVTGAQQVCALDARTGRSIWCTARSSGQAVRAGGIAEEPNKPAGGEAAARPAPAGGAVPFAGITNGNGPNRGAAVLGDRIFFVSDDAYMVCLNRLTGAVMWMVPLTDPEYRGRYYNTAAPLVVGDLIVSGVAGGDGPVRGFLVAFRADTGVLAWRFWTVPTPDEPLAATWHGRGLPYGGGATWTTGSYDPEAGTLYWAVGNPYPPANGDEREGSNLYTNSVIALDARTGRLKWHFQFTPHDLHDWDASEPLVLIDTKWRGKDRKLLLQANRSGFFYVLDRASGEFLLARPFVHKLTWARGIGKDGVPQLVPDQIPTEQGTLTCPNVRGATNWYASSFNPGTGLFYVMANEDCGIYRKTGSIYAGARDPRSPGKRYLRALDITSGDIVWEKALTGANEANYGGVLTTAGGLAFHGETGGGFAAVDARTGKTEWYYRSNDVWRASPISYMVEGRQYVAVAAGGTVFAFALSK